MAFRWRIRHKLMLGLAVVVGVIGLLLAGTVYGLAKFRATMKSTDAKHAESLGLLKPVSNLPGLYNLGPLNQLLSAAGQPQVAGP